MIGPDRSQLARSRLACGRHGFGGRGVHSFGFYRLRSRASSMTAPAIELAVSTSQGSRPSTASRPVNSDGAKVWDSAQDSW